MKRVLALFVVISSLIVGVASSPLTSLADTQATCPVTTQFSVQPNDTNGPPVTP